MKGLPAKAFRTTHRLSFGEKEIRLFLTSMLREGMTGDEENDAASDPEPWDVSFLFFLEEP